MWCNDEPRADMTALDHIHGTVTCQRAARQHCSARPLATTIYRRDQTHLAAARVPFTNAHHLHHHPRFCNPAQSLRSSPTSPSGGTEAATVVVVAAAAAVAATVALGNRTPLCRWS